MAKIVTRQQVAAMAHSPHLWLLMGLLALCTILQYIVPPGPSSASLSTLSIDLHSAARISYLLPISYAAMALGPLAGLLVSGASLLLMLHPALFLSTSLVDALTETGGIAVMGGLLCLYLLSQRKQKEQMETDLARLRWVHEELQYHVGLVERNERRLAALHDISNLVTQGLDASELLQRCVETIASATNVEVVNIYLMNPEGNELNLAAARGVSSEFMAGVDHLKMGEGLNGRVAESGESMVIEDMSTDPRLSRVAVRNEGLRSTLIVPLKFKGTIMGTICVAARRSRQFGPDEVALLTAIGNEVGVAIENARAHEQQEATLARLQVSERNYRTLFESSTDAILVRARDGRIVAANQACASLTGYPVDELVGMNLFDIVRDGAPAAAVPGADGLHDGAANGESHEWTLVRWDGTEATIALSTSSIMVDGDTPALQHVARDITVEKRMQENMRLYVQQVTRAQEEERKRIARELHDDTLQVLGALSREIDNFIRKNPSLAAGERGFLTNLREHLNDAVRDVRRFGQNLRPSVLDDLGLLPALSSLISELEEDHHVKAELKVLGGERRFEPEVELLIFRVVQEAISNIRRHAGASAASVTIAFEPATTIIIISDDGRGFELPGGVHDLPRSGKLGLVGIQERVRLLRGTLHIQSAPGKGTTLTIEVPA
ncbi:MAG: GAF domain-containing protein [Bacteroidetes bacterium]|nr:GAF domain-containing protein [Bacteroidota bacterium]MCL5025302.1 GAF domain-containing protein [Chloroflexota bacterium]